MPPQIALIVYASGIAGLFLLDRDRTVKTSKALWIPTIWLLINASRPVSQWLQIGPNINSPDAYLDGSPLDAAVFGVLLAAGLVVLAGRGRKVGTILRANLPLVLFFGYCAISTVWSDYSFVSAKRWIKSTGDVVMVLVVLTDPDRLSAIKRFLTRAGFVLLPVSVLLIKYYPDLGRSYNIWTWTPEFSGVTMGKNGLGMICLVFGLASVWRLLSASQERKSRERTRHLIAHGLVAASAVWLLWMANSMTSLLCFVMAGSLIATTRIVRLARKSAVVHLLVALIVCISVSILFLGAGDAALEAVGRDPTITGRTDIWNIVLGLVRNPLIGTGFESFWLGDRLQKVWDAYVGTHIQEAHNGYIEVYLNLGWFGITLLAVLILTGYRNVIQAFRRNPDVGRLRLAFVVAAVLYSLTEAGFRMMSPIWLAFLLAITAVPVVAAKKARPHSPPGGLPIPLSASYGFDEMFPTQSRKEVIYK